MKRFYLPVLMLIIAFSLNVLAQNIIREVPLFLQPDESLTDAQKQLKKRIYSNPKQLFKHTPPPKEYKFKPGPDRILNPDGFELLNITNAPDGQAETWIAIDRNNPQNIIGTANDGRYLSPSLGYRMPAYVTTDGGKSWKTTLTPLNQDLYISSPANKWNMTIFDPGITFDSRGWCYYSYGFTQLSGNTGQDDNGVFICRSKDKGMTWEGPYPVKYEIGGTTKPFHDRYMIIADANPNSKYKDYIYVAWKRFIVNDGILFSRSTDGGENWSNPKALAGGNAIGTQSATPVIGPDGEIYVSWEEPTMTGKTNARVQKSTDAGNTWLPDAKIALTVITIGEKLGGRTVLADKANMRVGSDPVIAVDCSPGSRKGWVYVAQAGKDSLGKYGIYITRSTDGGNKWTTPARIDNNTVGNDMCMPSICVDPITGSVSLFYYSSQNDTNNHGFDGYIAYSNDGINFSITRLTPATWYIRSMSDVSPQGSADNFYWGDYTCITAYNGKIYPCFWMPNPVNGSFYNLDVYTAVLSTGPQAPKALSAISTPDKPTTINLTWQDPSKNLLNGNIGDFKIIIYRNGTEIAQADKGTQKFDDDGLTDGQLYNYSIRARSADGESTTIDASAYAGGSPTPYAPENILPKPNEGGILVSWLNPNYHIDSTIVKDLSKIFIYVDDVLQETITSGIQAGSTSSTLLNVPTGKFYKIKFKAVCTRSGKETESSFSKTIIAYSGAPLAKFEDNFDDTQKRIPSYTEGKWGINTKAAKSAPNSLTDSPTGNYSEGNTTLIMAPAAISPDKATLSFSHIAIIDNIGGTDAGAVSISNDFGNTWKDLIWVNKKSSSGFTDSAQTSKWADIHLGLGDYVGDTIYIKFSLFANTIRNFDGWYIDDLTIDDNPNDIKDIPSNNPIDVSIFPNPVENQANLNVLLTFPGKLLISLYDNLGREIYQITNQNFDAGNISLPLNFGGIADGIYYCRISSGNYSKAIPIIVKR